jgi:hypothetical protein
MKSDLCMLTGEPTIATSIAYSPLLEKLKDKLTDGHDIKLEVQLSSHNFTS